MKIIDKREELYPVTEYELGQVYDMRGLIYMITENMDYTCQQTHLETGEALSKSYATLDKLYKSCGHDGERMVNAEMVIKWGDQK
ncbi:hypothetical protein [Lactiplantibacillus paraxiangfangensis]|uniref:hypothetical protein n=1 Tax=Lactiplantibacillus paraxiangfangensis TaxID=3076224 RepID=UPI0030C66047